MEKHLKKINAREVYHISGNGKRVEQGRHHGGSELGKPVEPFFFLQVWLLCPTSSHQLPASSPFLPPATFAALHISAPREQTPVSL